MACDKRWELLNLFTLVASFLWRRTADFLGMDRGYPSFFLKALSGPRAMNPSFNVQTPLWHSWSHCWATGPQAVPQQGQGHRRNHSWATGPQAGPQEDGGGGAGAGGAFVSEHGLGDRVNAYLICIKLTKCVLLFIFHVYLSF